MRLSTKPLLFSTPFWLLPMSSLKQAANELDTSGLGFVFPVVLHLAIFQIFSFVGGNYCRKPLVCSQISAGQCQGKLGICLSKVLPTDPRRETMALVIFSFCFLVHRFPVPNVSLCQDSFVLLATVLHLVEARIPYSTTPSPQGQPWHLRIISDGCDSQGLHSANRKHQRERSLKFLEVRRARQAL